MAVFTLTLWVWALEWCELNIGAKYNAADLLGRQQRCVRACHFIFFILARLVPTACDTFLEGTLGILGFIPHGRM